MMYTLKIVDNKFCSRLISICIFLVLLLINSGNTSAQEVPVQNHSSNESGQVQLEVNSTPDKYYILKIISDEVDGYEIATSMTMGLSGTTLITEPLRKLPEERYRVLEYDINNPFDTDRDGIDDITEYFGIPASNPLNAGNEINIFDGTVLVDSFSTFKFLSITRDHVQWSEFLNGRVFVKFIIADFDTESPKTYFINSNNHDLHEAFAKAIGIEFIGDQVKKGQIIYHPTAVSDNGMLGTFAFNYSNGHGQDFDVVQRCHELLASNMPFLVNNFSYYITANNTDEFIRDEARFLESRIPILLEDEVYGEVDYVGLNQSEGYGYLRQMTLEQIPRTRDIVIYDALPNSLPRVGGIITSVIQPPLSHVNLRAIESSIPNAYIRDPLTIDSISDLLDRYVYFKVEESGYTIREATLEEVNEWYETLRPTIEQIPPINLEHASILALDEIGFDMFDGFGAKCTNVATMRTFGFPNGTIPNGYGVPFYFYHEFMEHNQLFAEVESMLSNTHFQMNRDVRNEMLKVFRNKITSADMPLWMFDELGVLHKLFPAGTSIRCRSSTNNEDLPGFNGAGLYDSKTHHPDEGHISKTIKQVYASLWNLRAFEERDFHRVNHFFASMGVLCHPNYTDENANGVGVSTDPIYNTTNTFYLNTQLGEDLITNPSNTSIPEEILLDQIKLSKNDHIIIQRSSLIPSDSTLLSEMHLSQMRSYLSVIHEEFEKLYNATEHKNFAMDIEYKITRENQLIIKQARPWAAYTTPVETKKNEIIHDRLELSPNPVYNNLSISCKDCELSEIRIYNHTGQLYRSAVLQNVLDTEKSIDVHDLPSGVYVLIGYDVEIGKVLTQKFVKSN